MDHYISFRQETYNPSTGLVADSSYVNSSTPLVPYVPPFWAEMMHNYPRMQGGNILSTSEAYIRGLAYTSIPWIAVGAGLFLIVSLIWLASICIYKGNFRSKHRTGKCAYITYGTLWCFAILGCALLLIGAYLVSTSLEQVKTGVLMGRDSVAEVDDVFGNLQSLASNIDSLAKDISDQCADTTTTLGMNSVQSQAQNIKIQAAEVDGDVSSLVDDLDSIADGFGLARDISSPVVYAIAGVTMGTTILLGILAIVASTMQAKLKPHVPTQKCSTWKTISYIGCGLILPFSLMVACMCIGYTGVIIGGNSLAGDTCIAPEASLLGVMSGPSREFAQLYMYCSGPDVAALNTLAQSSNTLVSELNSLLADLDAAGGPGAVCKSVNNEWPRMIESMRLDSSTLIQSIRRTAKLLSCTRLNAIYRDTVHKSMCNNGGTGLFLAWVGALMAGVSLLTLTLALIYMGNPFLLTRHNLRKIRQHNEGHDRERAGKQNPSGLATRGSKDSQTVDVDSDVDPDSRIGFGAPSTYDDMQDKEDTEYVVEVTDGVPTSEGAITGDKKPKQFRRN